MKYWNVQYYIDSAELYFLKVYNKSFYLVDPLLLFTRYYLGWHLQCPRNFHL